MGVTMLIGTSDIADERQSVMSSLGSPLYYRSQGTFSAFQAEVGQIGSFIACQERQPLAVGGA
jgi:hypothetical protein